MWTKMEHSIKRLAEGTYYQHSVPQRQSYPWEIWETRRHRWRRMGKDEVRRRLLHDVQQKKMDTATRAEPEERDEPHQ